MTRIKEYVREHRHVAVLFGIVLALAAIPAIETLFIIGNTWQGILPPLQDEIYFAYVHTIGEGHLAGGNPYFLEQSNAPPLVIFGGAWLNAIPLFSGLPFATVMLLNFIIWSLLFAGCAYWLCRELRMPPWIAVFGTLFLYVQSYYIVWRPVNMQPVFPFYFLFYIAFLRLIREQSRRNVLLLALATGAAFYLFAYMWQVDVISLGLLFLYALVRKNWPLLKATLLSSSIGAVIGLPVPLYALWLSNASPYFWESVGRFGLVNTHLPMAVVIYVGGWIGVVCAFIAVLFWRMRALREDREFIVLGLFLGISGLGLWIAQGSNLITGKLLETGEHVARLIFPWIVFSTFSLGALLWKQRTQLSRGLTIFSVSMLVVLSVVNISNASNFLSFLPSGINGTTWQVEQLYAKPYAWLNQNEKNPVVVWSDFRDQQTILLPIYTKHFTLYAYWGMFALVPEGEIRERYLISQYFNNPTVEDLKNDFSNYVGRQDAFHKAKTIERGIKICRILYFWDTHKDCGTPPTSQELLGDTFFTDLENKFQNDIKPNIKAYLKKYHVAYILKDKILDPQYHPEKLGAVRVYDDDRYEIYHL